MGKIKRALVSVSDKRGLTDLARILGELGVEILSTGGTARALADAGLTVVQVSDYTGAPEILDGRVKTLHPKIHGGLLARPTDDHRRQLDEQGIGEIDLVVVNLYPFEETARKTGVGFAEVIENIDIGGPSMLRSAAKNHERVAVVVEPDDYPAIIDELRTSGGELSADTRFSLAVKAFAHTAAYDAAIAGHLSSVAGPGQDRSEALAPTLTLQWKRLDKLRYGENPHQEAAFYGRMRGALVEEAGTSLARAEVLQGKALSYNNILDLDAALACCLEFEQPTAVVVKHTNPCGVASDPGGVSAAYRAALACDPTSAFGGIVAVNRAVDSELAAQLAETFLECVVAPSFSASARDTLAAKKNLRLVATGEFVAPGTPAWAMRSVGGGLLVQSADRECVRAADAVVVTRRAPTEQELAALDFSWRVAKHIKSNAILFCIGTRTAAVGAGQMSRVDAANVARMKATTSLEGSVVASDAFFPFRDGVDALAEAGATAVIQPGGSRRDEEVIAAADEHGMAMVFTSMRHFRH